jgi:glycosyltransferase involved in cell wall biosynthesis
MSSSEPKVFPLVSVIIPCYNHGAYLNEAFGSIQKQNYPAIEVIVVDDGSEDDTKQVTLSSPGVKYVYQANAGLSAARNTGIRHSTGEYLIFLDADDWLYPGAVETNLNYLLQDERLAFVSGAHDKVFTDTGTVKEEMVEIASNHYQHLLQGNYIGMHATVMYRRWVFDEFQYDVTLRRCEDYDLYLKIARKYPVVHHTEKIAAYRLHTSNMSGNIPAMLSTVLEVLKRQEDNLKSEAERQSYIKGGKVWKEYYCAELYQKLRKKKVPVSLTALNTLLRYRYRLYIKFLIAQLLLR